MIPGATPTDELVSMGRTDFYIMLAIHTVVFLVIGFLIGHRLSCPLKENVECPVNATMAIGCSFNLDNPKDIKCFVQPVTVTDRRPK